MIELVDQHNYEELLPLIEAYQRFYKVADISTERNREFFAQFIGGNATGAQFVYRVNGHVVAFASVYFSFSSTLAHKVAVLNDLYVLPDHRQQGLAKELIDHCYHYGRNHDALRLQWLTAKDNTKAQALYDKVGAISSEWCFYALSEPVS